LLEFEVLVEDIASLPAFPGELNPDFDSMIHDQLPQQKNFSAPFHNCLLG